MMISLFAGLSLYLEWKKLKAALMVLIKSGE